jgi:hypothetical protein
MAIEVFAKFRKDVIIDKRNESTAERECQYVKAKTVASWYGVPASQKRRASEAIVQSGIDARQFHCGSSRGFSRLCG